MANLSACIDFAVNLNFKTNTILVTSIEVAGLPVGIAALDITASVKQPDCINGSLAIANSSIYPLVFSGSRTLRKDADGNPQKGDYIVKLIIKATGYENTIIEKKFNLQYERPGVQIAKNFNLLVPSLKFKDNSSYNILGLNTPTITRAWSINVGNVGVITPGNVLEADLAIAGQYYDAEYTANLTTALQYASPVYSYLTITDETTGDGTTTANTVPAFSTFPDLLEEINQLSQSSSISCGSKDCDSDDYKSAYVLFKSIELNICGPITPALLLAIDEFLKIYYQYKGAYVNTNTIIAAYDRSFCTSGNGENAYIRNTNTPQVGANINIDGSATIGNIPSSGNPARIYLVAEGGTIKHLTEAEMIAKFSGTVGAHTHAITDITGLSAALAAKVAANAAITGATKTKVTYDSKGLITSGADLIETDIPNLSQAKITGLVAALAAKSDTGHVHAMSEITGLVSELGTKALDSAVVKVTGNQAVAGVKTFSSSPIVPVPVNDAQAANKEYVDARVATVTPDDNLGSILPYKVVLAADGTYDIPAGKRLRSIVITPVGASTIKVGLTPTGDEVMISGDIAAGADKDIDYLKSCRVITTLYFQGITSSTTILIYTDSLTPINP